MEASFNPLAQRYPSARYPLYAKKGMVNCSSPLASAAGLEVLRRGGNAMDCAIAAAAALTVVEPTANGIGSDAFAIIWSEKDKKLYGLNSSGFAPMAASIERIKAEGRDIEGKMPAMGWTPVTVPGAPKAWAEIVGRFGRLSLSEVLAPAVEYAREGYPCAPNLAEMWRLSFEKYERTLKDECFMPWFRCFAPNGRAPKAGETVYLPDHANTLEAIGKTNAEAFYSGEIARIIDAQSRRQGGYLRYEDLAAYKARWVEPLRLNYRGYEVCEIPPNGQGIAALMALNVLKEFSFPEKESTDTYHRQIEAMKIAFADAFRHVSDPRYMKLKPEELLDPLYGAARAAEIGYMAKDYGSAMPPHSGTVYLCCADGEGNMVSYIQSKYMGFGSGIVVEGTGIALQNRGADFSLNEEDINCLLPGKHSYHTIIPGFLMKDGQPVGPFGVMGGYMQPQGHLQVVMNYVDFGLDPQQALDAPRWQWLRDGSLVVEPRFDPAMAEELAKRGHRVRLEPAVHAFGRGQMIVRLPGGVLVGGTESRTDSNIACY